MNKRTPPGNRKDIYPYSKQQPIPSMATPRRAESSNKLGCMGFVFVLGILGGMVWLTMLIFGWGPYHSEGSDITPTPTHMQVLVPEVPTLTSTQAPSPTETPLPTFTSTATVTSTATQELLPFVMDGEPEPVPSVMIRPQLGCDWIVIAGQVWDLKGDPVVGLTLHLFGELDGYTIDRYVLTGSEDAVAYGESGYEFAIENLLVDSEEALQIQLVETNGLPLSLPYTIPTFNDCSRNLILVNFKQVRSE